jgi:hypothetical protein
MRHTTTGAVGYWYYPLDPHEADGVDSVSESSTVSVNNKSIQCVRHDPDDDTDSFAVVQQPPYTPQRKSVRFDPGPDVTIHSSVTEDDKPTVDTLWYTCEDIMTFRQDVQRLLTMLASSRPEQDHAATLWIAFVYQAYRESAHKNPPATAPAQPISDIDDGPSLDEFIGLESWFPRPVQRDRQNRYIAAKRVVLGRLRNREESSSSPYKTSNRRLSQASQVVSHPARLFAQHMAQLVVTDK